MPRESEEKIVGRWFDRITGAEERLKDRSGDWDKYLRHYRQEVSKTELPAEDNVWLNLIFGTTRIILPSIYYQNPDILADPVGSTPLPFATIWELIIKHIFDETRYQWEMRSVILDTLFCGYGVMKYGYLRSRAESLTTEDELAMATAQSLFDSEGWLDEEQDSPKEASGDMDYRVKENLPFSLRVSPDLFIWDPLAGNRFERARWVAQIIWRPLESVKKDPAYNRALASGIEGSMVTQGDPALPHSGDGRIVSAGDLHSARYGEVVKLYEIWDREKNELLVLDDYHMRRGRRKFLRKDKNPYKITGFPFEIMVFNEDPKDVFGVSDVSTWYNPMQALNFINTFHYEHIKRTLPKLAVEQGSLFSDEDEAHLQSPNDCGIIHTAGPPDGAFYRIPDLPISQDQYALRGILQDGVNFLAGTTEQRRGVSAKAQTATEASIMEGLARVRDNDRLFIVSDFVKRGAIKLRELVRQFGSPEDFQDLIPRDMLEFWQSLGPQVLASKVTLRVRVGSSAFYSREVRNKQFFDWVNLFGGKVDPSTGQPIIDLYEAARYGAQLLEVPEADRFIIPRVPGAPGAQGPGAPGAPGATPGNGGRQAGALRSGTQSFGDMLSSVQNVGVRRGPNPREERV